MAENSGRTEVIGSAEQGIVVMSVDGIPEAILRELGEYRIAPNGCEYVFRRCPTCGDERHHFSVNIETGRHQCFKCQRQDAAGWSFASLGRKVGILPAQSKEHDRVLELKERAADWFAELLVSDSAAEYVRSYLESRGIDSKWLCPFEVGTQKLSRRLPIGFHPGRKRAREHFGDLGYTNDEINNTLMTRGMKNDSSLVFIYHTSPGMIGRFKVRNVRDPKKMKTFFLGTDGDIGAFGLALRDWRRGSDAFIVEGEFDCLSLQIWSLERQRRTVDVVAVSGGASKSAIQSLKNLGVKTLRIMPDNDEGGITNTILYTKQARQMGISPIVCPIPAEHKDPDEWVQAGDPDMRAVQAARMSPGAFVAKNIAMIPEYRDADQSSVDGLEAARRVALEEGKGLAAQDNRDYVNALPPEVRPGIAISQLISALNEAKNQDERNRIAATVVYRELRDAGKFLRALDGYYYFESERRRVIPFGSPDFTAMINDRFDLVASDKIFQHVFADLEAKCHLYGRMVTIRRFAYYDKVENILYIDKFDGEVYRLDGNSIELVPNGSGDGLFQQSKFATPYEILDNHPADIIDQMIISRINFAASGDLNNGNSLSLWEQRDLFRTWLYSLFFESIQPTKTILMLVGEKGSGKSTACRLVGQTLFGSDWDVHPVGTDGDYDALATNTYLLAFDNADTKKQWFADKVATTSTNGIAGKRKLYTTNEMVEYRLISFLMLNARTPKFKRDDIVDRMLVFHLNRWEDFTSESRILGEIAENRNALMTDLFHRLNECLKNIKQAPVETRTTKFRMADFAAFGSGILPQTEVDEFESLLGKMQTAQVEFLHEDDPLVDALHLWLTKNGNSGRAVTASQLYEEFKEMCKEEKMAFEFDSSRSLGQTLRHQKSSLGKMFEMETESKAGRPTVYKFGVKEEDEK